MTSEETFMINYWMLLVIGVLLWIIVMSWAAHQQYMIGHDTWLFAHKTKLEKTLQERKLNSIGERP